MNFTPIRPKDKFLVFGAPAIGNDEIDEVVATLKSGWIGTGPKVAAFENAFKTYKGAPHAAAVNSCTAALHLSMLAAGVGPGDEVGWKPHDYPHAMNLGRETISIPLSASLTDDDVQDVIAAVQKIINKGLLCSPNSDQWPS